MGVQMGFDDKKPSGGVHAAGKRRRVWTDDEKTSHKSACTGKQKLTYGQRMEVIRLHESSDPDVHKTQAQLAEMFGKSRSAISKILRPDAVHRIKATTAAGINQAVKRYFPPEHPELERRLYQLIEQLYRKSQEQPIKGGYAMGSQQLCANAERIAQEMGVDNFKPTAGWYSRFVKRYGLAKTLRDESAGLQESCLSDSLVSSSGAGPSSSSNAYQDTPIIHTSALMSGPHMAQGIMMRRTIPVQFKATWLSTGISQSNTRRLDVTLELDDHGNMIGGFEATMNILRQSFQQELMTSQARVTYKVRMASFAPMCAA